MSLPDEDWRHSAACRNTDPNLFVLKKGQSPVPAKKHCARCPVTIECDDFAIANEMVGVFGGRVHRLNRPPSQPRPMAPFRPLVDARPVTIRRNPRTA